MKAEELRKLFELEKRYWWFVGTRNVIERRLRRSLGDQAAAGAEGGDSAQRASRSASGARPVTLLDLGAGSGILLDRLRDLGRTVGLDISFEAARFCREKGHREMAVASAERLPYADGAFEVVVMADVLEHLPDEDAVLSEVRRVLAPDGRLVVNVPAFMLLWSHHDEAIGHYRRYRRASLVALLHRLGFETRFASYANFFLFPPFLAARLAQRAFRPRRAEAKADYPPVPAPLNALFIALLDLEARLLDRLSLPFGTSVLVVAHKK